MTSLNILISYHYRKTLFKFYRGKRPAITRGGVWHQSQTPPLTLLRGIIRV